jgi:hypothetical protein
LFSIQMVPVFRCSVFKSLLYLGKSFNSGISCECRKVSFPILSCCLAPDRIQGLWNKLFLQSIALKKVL